MSRHRRSSKLVQPGLQLRMVCTFVGMAGLALLLQFLVLSFRVTGALSDFGGEGGQLATEIPGVMLEVLLVSTALVLPVIFGFGILLTFRVAGPVHRLEAYFDSLARGEQVGPCRLRRNDELQGLCERINDATEPLRRREVATEAVDAEEDSERLSPAAS